jgi:triphosphatase
MSPDLRLDLSLHPDDVARLMRAPEFPRGPAKPRHNRPSPVRIIWHDTPDAALADAGLSLAEQRHGRATIWRLERTRPGARMFWSPGTTAPLVAEASDLAGLGPDLPGPLMPIAGFDGQTRHLNGGPVRMTVMSGELRAVAGARPVCRVALDGSAEHVAPLAHALAHTVRLSVPPVTFAAEAFATARPSPVIARRLGAPELPGGVDVGTAFAHIVAHLADVILHYAPRARAGETPEPVHQMRVALRRLRSAIQLFQKTVACAELDVAKAELRDLGLVLGPARDWDVFTAGTARRVGRACPDDAGIARLIAKAGSRRDAAYAALHAYLDGAGFRELGVTLAMLAAARPWERMLGSDPDDSAALPDGHIADVAGPAETDEGNIGLLAPPVPSLSGGDDLADFAARSLTKRLGRLIAPGEDVAGLPADDLHAIRLDAKRLRYACEFFAPLFPRRETKRFIKRLSDLQERLGLLNDGAVASALLAEIGHARTHAGGIVRGFVAATSGGTREDIDRVWRKFYRQDPFWP